MRVFRPTFQAVLIPCVLFAGLAIRWNQATVAQDVLPIPTRTPTEDLRGSMKMKLDHSQQILQGLVMRDFQTIKSAAGAMKKVTLADRGGIGGDAVDHEMYNHFRTEFLRLSTQVETMASEKNLEGAAYAYQNLTANCLACHQYLAGGNAVRQIRE